MYSACGRYKQLITMSTDMGGKCVVIYSNIFLSYNPLLYSLQLLSLHVMRYSSLCGTAQ